MADSKDEREAWAGLLRGEASRPGGTSSDAQWLWDIYGPLCRPSSSPALPGSYSVAHLGQSLDGKIGPPSGEQEVITSAEDMVHNHRMRALFDVVLVGAGTVFFDDPQLTVREVQGNNPVRVVVDRTRRLSPSYRVFQDGQVATLLVCDENKASPGETHGRAQVLGVPDNCSPQAILRALALQGLSRVFIEGGGVTVSRFLAAGLLDVLQLAVSPFILGRGRPGIDLDETLRLRPRVAKFSLGEDVLFQCEFAPRNARVDSTRQGEPKL